MNLHVLLAAVSLPLSEVLFYFWSERIDNRTPRMPCAVALGIFALRSIYIEMHMKSKAFFSITASGQNLKSLQLLQPYFDRWRCSFEAAGGLN